ARASHGALEIALLRVVLHAPRDVVHLADAPLAAREAGLRAHVEVAGGRVGARVAVPPLLAPHEAHAQDPLRERLGGVGGDLDGAHGVEAADLVDRGDRAAGPRRERPLLGAGRGGEGEAQAVEVLEGERLLAEARLLADAQALLGEAVAPPGSAALGDRKGDLVGDARAVAA